jgi:ribosomal protein L40E
MNTDATPGLDQQSTVRTTARVPAVVLLLAGVYLLFRGITGFVDDAQSMDGGFGPILTIGAGGFCVVFGLAAANVGWLRAQASYVAGETMPVVKESLDHLTAGPYCRQCGTRNDTSARFCDSCGQSLA